MIRMTATEVARNFSRVLDRLEFCAEEVSIERNRHVVAKLIPGAPELPAMDVFSDIYGILSDEDGEAWLRDCEGADRPLSGEVTDPWV